MLKYQGYEVNPFGEVTYLVWDTESHEAGVIDPGMSNAAERRAIDEAIEANGLKLCWIANTHMHLDHSFGVEYLKGRYGVGLWAGGKDKPLAERIPQQAVMFHLPFEVKEVTIDNELREGDSLKLGDVELKVIEMPGHTPGGLALYCREAGVVFTGDSLFRQSIGRTDLPGGNHHALLDSVERLLRMLPDDTVVIPGHGPATTVGYEKAHNPFL